VYKTNQEAEKETGKKIEKKTQADSIREKVLN